MTSQEIGGGSPEKKSVGLKEKLANLRDYAPGYDDSIYEFARFLSTRASDELTPRGFDLMVDMAIADLERGKDGLTGKPIEGKLVGYKQRTYALFKMNILRIKELFFDKEK